MREVLKRAIGIGLEEGEAALGGLVAALTTHDE